MILLSLLIIVVILGLMIIVPRWNDSDEVKAENIVDAFPKSCNTFPATLTVLGVTALLKHLDKK